MRKAIYTPVTNKNALSPSILRPPECFSEQLLAVAASSEAASGRSPFPLIRLRDATNSKHVCLQSVDFVAITEALLI